jgi:hypothetical protein
MISRPTVAFESIGFDTDSIVYGVAKTLLAAEIPLGRFDAHMPEQKLNLLQLATDLVAQPRAGAA